MCKGHGAAEVLEKATQAESPTEGYHVKEGNKNDEAFADNEEDEKTGVEGETKKRAPSSDTLFKRFTKRAKVELEDEENKEDVLGVDSDASDDEEDKVAHDDDNVEFQYDVDEDDEYGSDNGEDEENEEEEEDEEY